MSLSLSPHSCALLTQARQSNWLVVHLPRFDAVCRGNFRLAPSETVEGSFDQPLLAQKFFAELLELEGEKLKLIKLRGDYSAVLDDSTQARLSHALPSHCKK